MKPLLSEISLFLLLSHALSFTARLTDKENNKKSVEISGTLNNMAGLYLSKESTFLTTSKLQSTSRLNSEARNSCSTRQILISLARNTLSLTKP